MKTRHHSSFSMGLLETCGSVSSIHLDATAAGGSLKLGPTFNPLWIHSLKLVQPLVMRANEAPAISARHRWLLAIGLMSLPRN